MDGNRNSGIVGWARNNIGKALGAVFLAILTAIVGPIIVFLVIEAFQEPDVKVLGFKPTTPEGELFPPEESIVESKVSVYNEGRATAENCRVRIYDSPMASDADPEESVQFGLPPDEPDKIRVFVDLPSFPKGQVVVANHQVDIRVECNNDKSNVWSDEIAYTFKSD
jgi:hypothetical protein